VIDDDSIGLVGMQIVSESKKDPLRRRYELLIKSELAEVLPVPISLKWPISLGSVLILATWVDTV
jgi:hypothetical protein